MANEKKLGFWKKAVKEKRPYTVKELNQMYDPDDDNSGRYKLTPGVIFSSKWYKILYVVDMIIYPYDICPHCKSKNTYHKRIRMADNVWRYERIKHYGTLMFLKWDFCLSCQREILFDGFIYKRLSLFQIILLTFKKYKLLKESLGIYNELR